MQDCKPEQSPISDVNKILEPDESEETVNAPYRELLGSLNYCACVSRPDIAFAVSVLSKFCNAPLQKHWLAAKRLLRYLKGTSKYGLCYRKTDQLELNVFSDADWANDSQTRRSYSGVLLELCGAAVIYKSKQQSVVSLSTTEAEYIAASMAIRETLWLHGLLEEVHIPLRSTNLYIDNQGAIEMIKSREYRTRTKH